MALCHAWTGTSKILTDMSDDVRADLLFDQGSDFAYKKYIQDPQQWTAKVSPGGQQNGTERNISDRSSITTLITTTRIS